MGTSLSLHKTQWICLLRRRSDVTQISGKLDLACINKHFTGNLDSSGQTGVFSPQPFRVFLSDIILPQYLRHTLHPTVESLSLKKLFSSVFL